MTAVIAKPVNMIATIFSKLAVAKETRKTGNIKFNFTERKRETINNELYIQLLGNAKLRKKIAIEG